MGDVIDISKKLLEKHVDTLTQSERVEECFWHSMFNQPDGCRYCDYRIKTSKMLFEILMRDMLQATKTHNLQLTNIDGEFIIMDMIEHLRNFQQRLVETKLGKAPKETQDTGPTKHRPMRRSPGRKSTFTKTSQPITEGTKPEDPNPDGDGGGAA